MSEDPDACRGQAVIIKCERSIVVVHQLPKLGAGVRFSSLAHLDRPRGWFFVICTFKINLISVYIDDGQGRQFKLVKIN